MTLFSDDARSDGVPREGDPTRIDGLEPEGGAWDEASETAPAPRSRRIGAALIVGLAVKLFIEHPLGPLLRDTPGFDFPVAPFAHLTGALAGSLAWGLTMRARSRSPRPPHGT